MIKQVVAAVAAASAIGLAAPALAQTDVFVLPGANADSWAPAILERIDPWATYGPNTPRINANYYSCSGGCTVSAIPYPRTAGPLFGPNAPSADESIATGVTLTDTAIANTHGPIVVSGLSLGGITADAVQASLVNKPDAPPPSQLTFIVSGDPSRATPLTMGLGTLAPAGLYVPVLGWTVTRPPADSQYNTIVVVGEYDGTSDFPDRPWNLLADANAVAGAVWAVGGAAVHGQSSLSSPSQVPPQNITVTTNAQGATTTTYLVPTPTLPLLQPLAQLGVPAPVVSTLSTALKPVVDAGYSRNDTATGVHAPYLQPTNGLPRLVVPTPKPPTAATPKPLPTASPKPLPMATPKVVKSPLTKAAHGHR